MSWQRTSFLLSDLQEGKVYTANISGGVPDDVSGQKVVLIREGDEVYALEDRCSHDNSEFEGGQVIESNIECPRHGAWFDYKTGTATGMPAVASIKSLPTSVREGVVFVEV